MAFLIIERGEGKGKLVELKQGKVIVAGRSSENDCVLNDPMVSRKHFEIEGRDGKFFIRDNSSTNGTFLNGERITEERELEIGDKIEVGSTILSFVPHSGWRKKDTITGQNIAGYLILERIGRGGMGTVYKALQLSLDRTVALKILSKELCRDTAFIEMFVREARNAGQLNHPNILHVYDVGKFNDIYYLSMEYMLNGSLADLLRKHKTIKLRHAIPMMIDAAKGLEYAYKKGLVHRDIKPDNLMINDDGVVKIGDLGIARRITSESGLREDGLFGSPLYMSPEQARCDKVDHRSDIYSLGATFYHILSGRPLFEGKTPQEIILKQINEQPAPLKTVAPHLPDEVCAIIEKMLKKNPDERYQSATELLGDLEDLKQKLKTGQRYRAPKVTKKQIMMIGGIAAAVVLIVVLVFLVLFAYERVQKEYERHQNALTSAMKIAEESAMAHRYDDAIERLKVAIEHYKDVKELIPKAKELLLQIETDKKQDEMKAKENEANRLLEAANQFYQANPRKYNEAINMFKQVKDDYPQTAAAQTALSRIREIEKRQEEEKKLLEDAWEDAQKRINSSRDFVRQENFTKARAELLKFPKNYEGTKGHEAIVKEMKELEQRENQAFRDLQAEVKSLIAAGKFDEAKEKIEKKRECFSSEKYKDRFDSLLIDLKNEIAEQERLKKEKLLNEDRERFFKYFEEIQSAFMDFDFDSADSKLSSTKLLLQTDEYKNVVTILKELLSLASRLHNRLIEQINANLLQRPMKLTVGHTEADVCGADRQRVTAKYTHSGAEVKSEVKWSSLTVKHLVEFYSAMNLDGEDLLGIGAFLTLRGAEGAEEWFKKATEKDSTLQERVKRFNELQRWLKKDK